MIDKEAGLTVKMLRSFDSCYIPTPKSGYFYLPVHPDSILGKALRDESELSLDPNAHLGAVAE